MTICCTIELSNWIYAICNTIFTLFYATLSYQTKWNLVLGPLYLLPTTYQSIDKSTYTPPSYKRQKFNKFKQEINIVLYKHWMKLRQYCWVIFQNIRLKWNSYFSLINILKSLMYPGEPWKSPAWKIYFYLFFKIGLDTSNDLHSCVKSMSRRTSR